MSQRFYMRLAVVAVLCLGASRSAAAQEAVFQTTVAPLPGEDLAAECRYEVTLLDARKPTRLVWVIFDRGRDILRMYYDAEVRRFAATHGIALMLPFHCPRQSGSDGDMNMDPAQGIGRALFVALEQVSRLSARPELASAKLLLHGFSGTGSLVGRFTEYAPDRVVAVVATHPGHNPQGLDTIDLSARAASIPQFILTGSTDRITGTDRPYAYFRRYFDHGAPWTFVVQNKTPHCCTLNAKRLVLAWLEAAVVRRIARDDRHERYGFIETVPETQAGCPNVFPPAVPIWCHGVRDAWGGENWSVRAAAIGRHSDAPPAMRPAGWLPTAHFAKQWLAFVSMPAHPVTSLP